MRPLCPRSGGESRAIQVEIVIPAKAGISLLGAPEKEKRFQLSLE
jgi:hypothetical protein